MRDGINIVRRGLPAVALVTEEFWPQGNFIAASLGMPDVPRVRLPHPVAGSGEDNLRRVAQAVAPAILDALGGGA